MAADSVIVYISPEQLGRRRREELIRDRPDLAGEELLTALEGAEASFGEYRAIEDGSLHVWINETPDDPQDVTGRFEPYRAAEHGKPYHPLGRQA